MDFGLMSFGTALGDRVAVADVVSEYTADTERVLGYGYRNIHRAPDTVGLTDLAHEAGQRALDEAGVDPGELDLVVLAVTDITEYLYWDAAASLQQRWGADRAEAVLIDQGCIGGITCFDTIAGRFATHPDYRRALVVGANRTCDAYWNRMDTHSLLFSDGAAAAVVGRAHPHYRWRASEALSDGRYSTFFRLAHGGAAAPFDAAAPPAEPIRASDGWDIMEHFRYDYDLFAGFVDEMNDRVDVVVRRACARVGAKPSDLARISLLNDNARTLTDLAAKLDLPLDRTNIDIAAEYGHFGAGDQLFNLARYVDALHPGDLVAVAGVGRGMHWACAVFEV